MKNLTAILLGAAMVLAVPLVGQDQAPDKDKQKQEEPKAKTPSDQKSEAPPQAPEEKPKSTPANPHANPQSNRPRPPATQQKPGHNAGQRIPAEKFQANFGRQHHFRIKQLEQGRRFRQAGFVFEIVEALPAGWSFDDDCFIEQDADDYFLVNAFHPDLRILVIVVEG